MSVRGSSPSSNTTKITAADSPTIDAFCRIRTSNPFTVYDNVNHYGTNTLAWENILNGGLVTHLPNESSIQMTTNAVTSGNYAYRQSRFYTPYQPGKSQEVLITGLLGSIKENVRQRVGLFDIENGLFFEQDGTDLKVVRRTFVGGSAADISVKQSLWNIDKMDGTGVSGRTIDMSKVQIFFIDFEWLGVGRVRFGFVIDGIIYYCHQFLNSNTTLTTVYMTTAHLPIRWEVENTGTAASATIVKVICCSVISEGGYETNRGFIYGVGNGITAVSVTTRRAILSIRPKTTLGTVKVRTPILPIETEIITKTNDIYYELVYNPSFTTPAGLTWTSNGTESVVEYCIHADALLGAFTNGSVIHAGYVIAGSGSQRGQSVEDITTYLQLSLDAAGANPTAFSLVATSFTGTAVVNGSICWKELA
jgi:hypothetical protein